MQGAWAWRAGTTSLSLGRLCDNHEHFKLFVGTCALVASSLSTTHVSCDAVDGRSTYAEQLDHERGT